jgi:ribonucleotide monophosphatase NagD (HAD superfamily)
MKYCFDIDGTICSAGCEYKDAEPYDQVIDKINELYDGGHHIQFFTSRGTMSGEDWSEFTTNQLAAWGVMYHELTLGKPHYDLFVDDRAVSHFEWYADEDLEI